MSNFGIHPLYSEPYHNEIEDIFKEIGVVKQEIKEKTEEKTTEEFKPTTVEEKLKELGDSDLLKLKVLLGGLTSRGIDSYLRYILVVGLQERA